MLRTLADKAYSDLEEKARERLALGQFLSNIDNPQVAFGVRQKCPETLDAAVMMTIELESYLKIATTPTPVVAAATAADESEPLSKALQLLNERLDKLEVMVVSKSNHLHRKSKIPTEQRMLRKGGRYVGTAEREDTLRVGVGVARIQSSRETSNPPW